MLLTKEWAQKWKKLWPWKRGSGRGCFSVTGSGRGFCAGADVKDLLKQSLKGRLDQKMVQAIKELIRSSKPVIAAMNGAAIGVGLTSSANGLHSGVPEAKQVAADNDGLVPELKVLTLIARCGFGAASEHQPKLFSGRGVKSWAVDKVTTLKTFWMKQNI